jgi:hypothetical protein
MKEEEPQHTRGLLAVQESKTRRRDGYLPAIPTRFWLWTLTVLVVWAIFYWRKTQGEIESQKAVLFARQRGVVAELGAKFDPLRKRIEDWTIQASGPYQGDLVATELKTWDFATVPGIYLRLKLADGASAESIRKAATRSLRDGFTACLFREPNADPSSGPPCKASHDCAPVTHAQFFLLVLDEEPPGVVLPPDRPALETIQGMPHAARVALFGLKAGMEKPLLRVRRQVAGQFLPTGANAPTDPDILASQQRQVNSCQLALQVREELGR